jgi:hypothetical protein
MVIFSALENLKLILIGEKKTRLMKVKASPFVTVVCVCFCQINQRMDQNGAIIDIIITFFHSAECYIQYATYKISVGLHHKDPIYQWLVE